MITRMITSFWFIAAATFIPPVEALRGWNRMICYREIVLMLESGKLSTNDTEIFAMSPREQSLMSDINNIALTTSGCSRLCDSEGPTLYSDSIPRLTQWLLPVLLLIMNMPFGSSKSQVLASVMHILGDPIHATWSLLAKVELWNQSLVIAEKVHTSLRTTRQQDSAQEKSCHKLGGTPKSNGQANESEVIVCAVEASIQSNNNDQHDIQGKQVTATQIQHIAVIIASLSELFRPFNATENPEAILQTFTLAILQPITSPLSIALCSKTATDLITSRTSEILRTYIAIALYLFQVVSAFVPALGDSSSPSGAKIGMAILFSFLLPMVLLSNSIGGFSARRKCLQIILRFLDGASPEGLELFRARLNLKTRGLYLSSMGWESGGFDYAQARTRDHYEPSNRSDSFLPEPTQPIRNTPQKKPRHFFLVLTAFIPVLVSCTTAAGVLWTSPTNLTCRHFLVISVFFLWLLSSLLTFLFAKFSILASRLYTIVFLKDSLFATVALSLIIGSSCGLFNNCWCSGLGSGGRVYLNPADKFEFNNRVYYPAWVGGCFAVQLGIFGAVRWGWGRKGFGIMDWSEREKEAEVLGWAGGQGEVLK